MSEKKIKIFQVISRLNVGGAAVYVILLAEHLKRMGYDSQLINGRVTAQEGEMLDYLDRESYGFQHHVIPELGRSIHPLKDLLVLWKLCRLFARERPDIVHSHASKAGFLARIAALLTGVSLKIHSFHGTVFSGYFGRFSSAFFIFLEKFLGRRTDLIFTDADMVSQELIQHHISPPQRIRVMPIGIDTAPFSDLNSYRGFLRQHLCLEQDIKIVGIIARLVPIKGVDVFLRAASLVCQSEPKTFFVITGDGELRDELQNLSRELGISERVRFMGFWKDLREIYADTDVSVLSSHSEGCPVAILEAMACEKPVVATEVGGVSDVVKNEKNGLLVPDGDSEKMAQSILRLLRDSEYASLLAQQGKQTVAELYTIEKSVLNTEMQYRQSLLYPHHKH